MIKKIFNRSITTKIPFLIGLTCVISYLLPFETELENVIATWGGNVTTKPVTALCLLIACMRPLVMNYGDLRHSREIGVALLVTMVVGFMGIHTATGEHLTVGYNVPSVGTAAMFIAISLGCFKPPWLGWCGKAVILLCSVAAVGHVFEIPALYYYVEYFSTAMARPTMTAGFFLGFGMMRTRVFDNPQCNGCETKVSL